MSYEKGPRGNRFRGGTADFKARAILILRVLAEGEAGSGDIWRQLNQDSQVTVSQIQYLLPRMAELGHIATDHRRPVTWQITRLGREWLKREGKKK